MTMGWVGRLGIEMGELMAVATREMGALAWMETAPRALGTVAEDPPATRVKGEAAKLARMVAVPTAVAILEECYMAAMAVASVAVKVG